MCDSSYTTNTVRAYVIMSEAAMVKLSQIKIQGTVKIQGGVKFH